MADIESTTTVSGNTTVQLTNVTQSTASSTVHVPAIAKPTDLPEKGAAESEHVSSLIIFTILFIAAICILCIHVIIKKKLHYIPESIAVVFVGAIFGAFMQFIPQLRQSETFSPTVFFLVFLPPIIFESGYNMHKGNFFHNIGSILIFAIFGTVISALVVGGAIYGLGCAGLIYPLTSVQSFAFGSLISAVDPVATLAIFQALDVDPILYMLVFGESILNDAISIVLTSSVLELSSAEMASLSSFEAVLHVLGRFSLVFGGSALIGVVVALAMALLLKHVDLRNTPSLEFAMLLITTYLPYGFAEGLRLSGIMAILFCGITMSHYTHVNLSLVTRITSLETFRTISFLAETVVFAYLGMAMFSFRHRIEVSFIIWSIVLILIGRALNIFPLSFLVNRFRQHPITMKMQFVMWFSGLRGAIAFALSLHLEFSTDARRVLITTTLIVVLFTIVLLGGGTLPVLKLLERCHDRRANPPAVAGARSAKAASARRRRKKLYLSKVQNVGDGVESFSELAITDDEVLLRDDADSGAPRGFAYWDAAYLKPFFTRPVSDTHAEEERQRVAMLAGLRYEAPPTDDAGGAEAPPDAASPQLACASRLCPQWRPAPRARAPPPALRPDLDESDTNGELETQLLLLPTAAEQPK